MLDRIRRWSFKQALINRPEIRDERVNSPLSTRGTRALINLDIPLRLLTDLNYTDFLRSVPPKVPPVTFALMKFIIKYVSVYLINFGIPFMMLIDFNVLCKYYFCKYNFTIPLCISPFLFLPVFMAYLYSMPLCILTRHNE